MIDAQRAKIESALAVQRGIEQQKRDARNQERQEKIRVAAERRTARKLLLPKYWPLFESEMKRAVQRGEKNACVTIEYPEPGVLWMREKELEGLGYQVDLHVYQDNEGPDLHHMNWSWL